jgi:hypothetical protein
MTLHLVVHHPDETPGSEAEQAVRAALTETVWEVAESHWTMGAGAMLVGSDLSSDYLLAHFRSSLARRGFPRPGMLLIAPMGEGAARAGLPPDAEAWIAEQL